MICLSLIGPSLEELKQQIEKANQLDIDLIELRFDLYVFDALKEIKQLIKNCHKPLLFTLRHHSHGGKDQRSDEERKAFFLELASWHPEYMDIEYDSPEALVEDVLSVDSDIKIIISYHNFESTPDDLHAYLKKMQHSRAYAYKLATMANSSIDALRMLAFIKEAKVAVTGICMGIRGQMTRILQAIFGTGLCYVSLDSDCESAPGQLSVEDLHHIYHYRRCNQDTVIYALIGDPVDKSSGHLIHNAVFEQMKINAIYVKIHLQADELTVFFDMIKQLPFHGLSVTMPYKLEVIPFLDQLDIDAKKINAVNTIHIKNREKKGFNTDGLGSIDAIEDKMPLKGKCFFLIGAGGSARAMAYIAHVRGANVVIFNRNYEKAKELALFVEGEAKPLNCLEEELKKGCDILFNATNIGMAPLIDESLIQKECLVKESLVMDAVFNPRETKLLRQAKEQGCMTISGVEMFINQAVEQQIIWFEKQYNSDKIHAIITNTMKE